MTSVTTGTDTATYTYNPDGLATRIEQGTTTDNLLWDPETANPLLLADGAAGYLHGPGGPLAETDPSGTYQHLGDRLGSTTLLTDNTGTPVGAAAYTPYGARTVTGVTSALGHGGELHTPAGTYLRARHYQPGIGQFLSADTVQPNAPGTQGWNPYAYANNNPTKWVDPTGHYAQAGQLAPLWTSLLAGGIGRAAAYLGIIPIGFVVALIVILVFIALVLYCVSDPNCWATVTELTRAGSDYQQQAERTRNTSTAPTTSLGHGRTNQTRGSFPAPKTMTRTRPATRSSLTRSDGHSPRPTCWLPTASAKFHPEEADQNVAVLATCDPTAPSPIPKILIAAQIDLSDEQVSAASGYEAVVGGSAARRSESAGGVGG